jgi:hypothetical protein
MVALYKYQKWSEQFKISKYTKFGEYSKGRRFDSHRGQAYFSSFPGVYIHSE